MKAELIEAGQWYAVRLGQWIEAARVDGFNPVTGKWIAYLHAMHAWRPLPASAFVRESMDPEQLAAMERKERMESRLWMQDEIQRQTFGAPAPVDRVAGCGGEGESRFYAIVCRQGSFFHAGDYGVSRE
jgi:hypothetical protein